MRHRARSSSVCQTSRCHVSVLARHIVQGLRDHNLTLAHDRSRLRAERRKLLFYDHTGRGADDRLSRERVLCLANVDASDVERLLTRERPAWRPS